MDQAPEDSFEEVLAKHLWMLGPVIAIGRPGEKVPPCGAAQEYINGSDWQSRVVQLFDEAAAVVAIMATSDGLAWELNQITTHVAFAKLVLIMPPDRASTPLRWSKTRELLLSRVDIGPFIRGVKMITFHKSGKVNVITTRQKYSDSYKEAIRTLLADWLS
jgi:hypothetical protein